MVLKLKISWIINLNINFKKHKFLLILIKKLTFNFNQINKFKLNNLIKLRKIKENHLINLTTNELNLDNNNYKESSENFQESEDDNIYIQRKSNNQK